MEVLDRLAVRRPDLAEHFRQWWETPAAEYSAQLWAKPPAAPIEPALQAALRAESVRVCGDTAAAEALIRSRIAATAQHITPTNGPGFLSIDQIAAAGKPAEVPLIVLAWSGVPLSNSAWSGSICFSGDVDRVLQPGSQTARRMRRAQQDRQRDSDTTEIRLSLFPSKLRDALLYRIPIPERLSVVLGDLTPDARMLFADVDESEDYPTWALRSCARIQRQVLGVAVVYLDLNRIIADYLHRIAAEDAHPLIDFLQDADRHAAFSQQSWAYRRRSSGKVAAMGPEAVSALLAGEVCPGLVPSFLALRCLNGIRCLGSFNQWRYVRDLVEAWEAWADPQPSLVTGRSLGEQHPLDLALAGTVVSLQGVVMKQLWAPLVPRLLRLR